MLFLTNKSVFSFFEDTNWKTAFTHPPLLFLESPINRYWNQLCFFLGLWRALLPQSFMFQCREEFSVSKVIDKQWFFKNRILAKFTGGRVRNACSENWCRYSFIIKGKVGRGRRPSLSFLSRCHASIISSSSRLSKGFFLPLHGQARCTNYCFYVCREQCPGDH